MPHLAFRRTRGSKKSPPGRTTVGTPHPKKAQSALSVSCVKRGGENARKFEAHARIFQGVCARARGKVTI